MEGNKERDKHYHFYKINYMNAAKLLMLVILLSGCMTTEKATNYLVEQKKLPGICATYYPPKIEYKQGQTLIRVDTVTQIGDSIPCPPVINGRDTVRVKVKCPDAQTIYEIKERIDTIELENTAKIQDLQYRLGDAQAENLYLKGEVEHWKVKADRRGRALWIIGSIIGMSLLVFFGLGFLKR